MAQTESRKGRTRGIKARTSETSSNREEPLSREWLKEIRRRVKDSEDPIRYVIASEMSRRFVLYYNVSSDSFAYNNPEGGTLFKRREIAERVKNRLGKHYSLVKFTTANGCLKRLSPVRPRWK